MGQSIARMRRLLGMAALTMPLLVGVTLLTGCPLLFPPVDNGNENANANVNDNDNDNGNANENDNDNQNENATGNSGLTGKYLGSAKCGECHRDFHTNWSATLHARALESLESINQGSNAECLGCHTVGFGEPGGFKDRATTNALAGVGCESCHGPGRDHVENIIDRSRDPVVDISANVCGRCHTGEHHPNFEEWETSAHAEVTETVAEEMLAGENVNRCGICHSGDVFYAVAIKQGEIDEAAFLGLSQQDLTPVSCAICHDPHMRTGNAPEAEDGRDFQLRFAEVRLSAPVNSIDAVTNVQRFNLCGQCHHSRGRDWTSTSRGPHHSVQANVFLGEMAMPVTDDSHDGLVPSRVSVHIDATEQCATCHLFRKDFQSEVAPAIAGHTFQVDLEGCVASDCHPSVANAEVRRDTLFAEMESLMADVEDALDNWAAANPQDADPETVDWEYAAEGGPPDQSGIPEQILKARFLLKYAQADGSRGMHNPAYVRSMLQEALDLVAAAP